MNTITFGSVISGTMRKEDLIPAFLGTLLSYDKESIKGKEIKERMELEEDYYYHDSSSYDLEELIDELNNLAPSHSYFGCHPGDGSDYGFWIDFENLEYDFDGLKVDNLSAIPNNYNGEVLFVNDHGNMTLYNCQNSKLDEVWSVV